MTRTPAWLPDVGSLSGDVLIGQTAAGATFNVPALTEAEADTVADGARAAALEARDDFDIATVISAVSRAAFRLADPEDTIGGEALAALAASGGWPEPTARRLLERNAAGWTEDALTGLVVSELGNAAYLDAPQLDTELRGRSRRAAGPPALLLILAGNVPGVAVTAVIRGLLVRSAVLCKLPRDEPDLVGLFARALHETAPPLAATIAATWWPAENPGPAAVSWTKRAGKVVVYGGAEAVDAIRARTPAHVPLVEYGPRLGIAVLGSTVSDRELAGLARDTLEYDQAGCVSPRLVYVLSDNIDPGAERSARAPDSTIVRLAGALSTEVQSNQGAPLSGAEATAIRAARAGYQFDEGAEALGPADLWWSVLYRPGPGAYSEALPRTLWVYGASPEDLAGFGGVLGGRVQAVGVAGLSAGELEGVRRLAVEWGVSRVVPVGEMAWPPADWRHDGRMQLMPLLSWTEFED